MASRIDSDVLTAAFTATCKGRGTDSASAHTTLVLSEVKESARLKELWERYRSRFDYARDITWDEAMRAASMLIQMVYKDRKTA